MLFNLQSTIKQKVMRAGKEQSYQTIKANANSMFELSRKEKKRSLKTKTYLVNF